MADYLDPNGEPQQTVPPPAKVYLDDRGNPIPASATPAGQLQGAVAFASQQDPVKYAKLLDLQRRTGIPPVVSNGNEDQVKQAAGANSLDPQQFTANAPRTAQWASSPDNAAVSGVDELHRVGGIEQNATAMRATPMFSAYTPTWMDKARSAANAALKFATAGGVDLEDFKDNLYANPATRLGIDAVSGTAGMIGNIGSFFGLHGDGPTKQNVLQRIEAGLSPEANVTPGSIYAKDNGLDFVAKNVAPMLPAMFATGGTSLVARTLGWSPTAAKVAQALTVGGMFTADQGGAAYTSVAGSGGTDDAARLAANRTAAINAIPNTFMGFTDMIPGLNKAPLLTAVGTGALTGAAGKVSQNVITGKPWGEGVGTGALQGAAVQGGMHLGMDGFIGHLGQAVDAAADSELKARSPEKFQEAMSNVFAGDPSLRIPADQFHSYFTGKGIDPAGAASDLGSTNYPEAMMSGGDVEVPTEKYLSKLDAEHQAALLPHVKDPATDLTLTQQQEGIKELQDWQNNGGPEKMIAEALAADADTQASPEYSAVKEQLRAKYEGAGETPEVAETLATKDANVYTNLAKQAGIKLSELMGLYNPKVTAGEAPTADQVLHQKAVESIRTVVESAVSKDEGHARQKAVIAPVHQWVVDAAKSQGIDLDGYSHVIDGSAVNHAMNRHSDVAIEKSRGQLPISKADFDRIPEVIDSPDRVVLGTKTKGNKDQVGYIKRMDDGTTLHLEEVRSGKKELAMVSMRKYPATKDFDAIVDSLPSNARGDGGNKPIIVEPPAEDKGVLHQSAAEGPRGWFRQLPDGSFEIGKTKIGDFSTFAHESAHAYLKVIGDLAQREGASDVLKRDHERILDYLGAKPGDELTTEQQEKWAAANEQYLREGKAPSAGLRGTFQRLGIWLRSVYEKASDLGVTLDDNIRGVLDRLYAAEDGVSTAAQEAGPRMFTSAEEAGWTEEQFRTYADQHDVSVEQAKQHILAKINEARLREAGDAWKEEQKNARAAFAEQIDASPQYKAIRELRKGEMEDGTPLTLSKESLVSQFGEDRVKALQKQHPGLYRAEGGVDAETAAEMHGFSSAEEMMSTLEQTPRRSVAIDSETQAYMTAKHGDIRYDGTLPDQARLAVENDNRAKTLHAEMTALKRKVAAMKETADGQKQAMRSIEVAPIASYREAAHQMIESKPIADLQPTRYLDASRKYSREAFDALRRGDTAAAAEAKHKELMNHFLFREASAAKDYVATVESHVKRMQTKGVQSKLGLAGEEYRAQFNKILGRYGMLTVPSDEPASTLAEWASAQYEAGKEPAIDQSIYDETRMVNYRNASVSEIRNVHDALKNVRALANMELGITVNGRRVEFNAATESMSAKARESIKVRPTPIFDEDRTLGAIGLDYVQRGTAPTVRTEFLMKRLDGGISGPWHDNLWHLAADAQGVERKLQEDVTGRIGDAMENMPKEQRDTLQNKVSVPGIDTPITRKRMISIALNMGNEGNLDRLQKTFVAHGWDPSAIDHIKGMLSREEWKFVQDTWESLNPLGKAQSELEKRLTGLPPVMVKPTPLHIDLADGTSMDLDGGYYPIAMDPKYSARGAQQDAGTTAQNLMESGYGRAATSRGNMKERTGFGGPLLLDHEQVLTQHIAKVTKDVSHREFILAANKILMDPQIRQTLRDTVGEAYEKQMMPWLRTLINDRNGSTVQGLGDLSDWMSKARSNVVQASLGFKASTMLLQLTHASSVFLHTSPKSYAQALIDFMAHPSEMTEQIRGLSPNEMSNRGENIDRDMRQVLQESIGKPGIGKVVAKAGMFPVKMMDHVLSFPLWLASYRDGLATSTNLSESAAHYQAMQKADGAVRMGLGSNAPKDLPAIMRKNDFWKLVTTLGGFHNLKLNQIMDVGHDYGRNKAVGNLTYGMMMAAIIPAVLGAYVSGNRPKDDENPGEWAAHRALLFAPETVPIVGDVVQALDEGRDAKFSPLGNLAAKAVSTGIQVKSDKENKDWTGIGLNMGEVAGQTFGVTGTEQAVKTLRYAHRAQQGNITDPNVWDAITGARHK